MLLLCIYRGCEKQGPIGGDEYYYFSQTETKFNNELEIIKNKIGVSPNR